MALQSIDRFIGIAYMQRTTGNRLASSPDHESKCKRCMQCCYRKVIIDGLMYQTPFPCEYLDVDNQSCSVYSKRHTACPECLNIEEAIRIGVLPGDCPYVSCGIVYNEPSMLPDAWMDEITLRALARALDVSDAIVSQIIERLRDRNKLRELDMENGLAFADKLTEIAST